LFKSSIGAAPVLPPQPTSFATYTAAYATFEGPRHTNEDVLKISQKHNGSDKLFTLLTVLDGHGSSVIHRVPDSGKKVANSVAVSLKTYFDTEILKYAAVSTTTGQVDYQSFVVDMLESARLTAMRNLGHIMETAGATVTIVLLVEQVNTEQLSVYVTNLGDSRAVLANAIGCPTPPVHSADDLENYYLSTKCQRVPSSAIVLTHAQNVAEAAETRWLASRFRSLNYTSAKQHRHYRYSNNEKTFDVDARYLWSVRQSPLMDGLNRLYGIQLTGSIGDSLLDPIKRSSITKTDVRVFTLSKYKDAGVALLLASDGVWEPLDRLYKGSKVKAASAAISVMLRHERVHNDNWLAFGMVDLAAGLRTATHDDITALGLYIDGYVISA